MNRLAHACLLGVMCLWVSIAHAAVAVDGVPTTANQVLSFSHTLGASANLLLVCIGQQAGAVGSASGVTVGGEAMTELANATSPDGNQRAQLFFRLAPLTGARTIEFLDGSGNPWLASAAISFTGAAQVTPTNTASGGEDGDTTPSLSVTSAVGQFLVDCVVAGGGPTTTTPGAGQAEIFDFAHDSSINLFGSTEVGAAGSVTMSWTLADAKSHAEVAVSLAPLVTVRKRVIYDYK